MGSRNLIDAAPTLRRGGSDSTVTRTCRATGEALLVPRRNHRSRVDRITGSTGKSIEGERVTDGFAVASKRVTPVERRSPAVCKVSDHKEGKDEMTKASIDLQDLRRRIYVKAKAETSWKFCEPGTDRASAGRGGVGGRLYQTLKLFNGYRVVRPAPKVAPAGSAPNPWGEANRRAQCGKSACCVRRGGGWKRGTAEIV